MVAKATFDAGLAHNWDCDVRLWIRQLDRLHDGPQQFGFTYIRAENAARIDLIKTILLLPICLGVADVFITTVVSHKKKFV